MITFGEIHEKINTLFKQKDRNYVLASQIISAIIALISGKLIAIYVSPEDFGTYGIQFATYTFFTTLLIHPIIQFIKTSNNTLIPRIGIKPFVITMVVSIGISYLLMASFLAWYYGTQLWPLFILLFFFILTSSLNNVLNDHLNIRNRLIDFSKLALLRSISALLFISLYFYIGYNYLTDIYALWAMQLFGGVLGLLFFGRKYHFYLGGFPVKYSSFFKKYIRYAWPLIFLALWTWISNYFDRYAIEYFLSTEKVGIYSASYGVGSKIFLVLSPIFMIMVTPQVYAVVKRDQKKKVLERYGKVYTTVAIPILVVIYFTRNIIGKLLLSDQYSDGFFLIFWIAIAFYLLTLSKLYELYFFSEKNTRIIFYANGLSALVNLLLNIILLKPYGLFGAAIASCIAFMVHFGIIFIKIKSENLRQNII
ncbi:lipopolysaccharide biosynthesis protein [Robiginitalea biformata]|uniref:Polysaccharide biosynthesis protein n=1 Tax=Robiginitalea biformata (strain ATCC BAA-864 / DSM 15991 / KCTC 12146 / HTCC2501) TaxID=313596 RepID=A4CP24_ROBBH|nr:lipopolysaccharide biosynthesis protein [Robiginitalea biformata]EAR14641.1 polysaccharide biosynthesis protein [Robiginitalea biformata HTCC2501]